MNLGLLACALGHHRVDKTHMRKAGGMHVGRCRGCAAPMEEVEPHSWQVLQVRDAGLGPRNLS